MQKTSNRFAHLARYVKESLSDIFQHVRALDGGRTAQYIPQLANADPDQARLVR
jgi:glutaminase